MTTNAYDCILNYCGPRESLELARVNAGWRCVPRLAHIARVFRDALAHEACTRIIADVCDRHFYSPIGRLSAQTSPIADIVLRLAAHFSTMCDPLDDDMAQYFVPASVALDEKIVVAIAAIASCNSRVVMNFSHESYNIRNVTYDVSVPCIAYNVSIQELAPSARIMEVMRVAMDRGGHVFASSDIQIALYTIVSSTNPSPRMTDCLECLISNDFDGALEYLPYAREYTRAHIENSSVFVIDEFLKARSASSIIRIGPVLARELMRRDSCRHHVARIVQFESPEFDAFSRGFEANLARKWSNLNPRDGNYSKMIRRVCEMIICSARNPDARVFEYVFAKLRAFGIIMLIGGVCDIWSWNCGEGLRRLDRIIARITSKNMKISFDNEHFWNSLRVSALSLDEAVPCIARILEQQPYLRISSDAGYAASTCLRYCADRFGSPMRELLAAHHIVCESTTPPPCIPWHGPVPEETDSDEELATIPVPVPVLGYEDFP